MGQSSMRIIKEAISSLIYLSPPQLKFTTYAFSFVASPFMQRSSGFFWRGQEEHGCNFAQIAICADFDFILASWREIMAGITWVPNVVVRRHMGAFPACIEGLDHGSRDNLAANSNTLCHLCLIEGPR